MQQIIDWIKDWIKSHSKPFWIGGSVSAFPTGYILFSDIHIEVVEFLLRLVGVAMAGLVGGFFTSLGKDYSEKRKELKKRKRDEKNKREIEEGKRKERAA